MKKFSLNWFIISSFLFMMATTSLLKVSAQDEGSGFKGKIYCISGLGADYSVFKKLFIEHYELVPVHWAPFDLNDNLSTYARKLAVQIDDKNAIIIGLSFGGMLAVEIAKQQPTRKIFIISSAKTFSGLRMPGGGVVRWLFKTKILPARCYTIPNRVAFDYFGAKTPEEKQLLRAVMRASDGRLMKWALKKLLTWENKTCPENVIHIHGTADRIIPSAIVNPDYWIEGGTHIMVYNRADEISKIISDCLSR